MSIVIITGDLMHAPWHSIPIASDIDQNGHFSRSFKNAYCSAVRRYTDQMPCIASAHKKVHFFFYVWECSACVTRDSTQRDLWPLPCPVNSPGRGLPRERLSTGCWLCRGGFAPPTQEVGCVWLECGGMSFGLCCTTGISWCAVFLPSPIS